MSGSHFVPTLYQAVCLSPEPAASTSILHINANNNASSLFGAGRKRHYDEISDLDEEQYSRKHLASEASVFFRQRAHNPRSILWRILDNRQLLELQSVDLVQGKQQAKHESCLTFHVSLPASILPGGVALADSQTSDALEVFVLTSANELYTITLKRDLLLLSSPPKDFDPTSCIRKHSLSSLSFHQPYKLAAVSTTQLLISLHDGGILRLERDSIAHSAAWKETFFSEGGWTGTLRGLIPLKRHQTVRYGELELEPSAAVALALSPDEQHIWTVSLDHVLSAWSTRTGKVVARRDLTGARDNPNDKKYTPQYIMSAEQGNLLNVIAAPEPAHDNTIDTMAAVTTQQYQIVVYSPRERAFKLFFARPGPDTDHTPRIYDVVQGAKLGLPFDDLINTNLWRCTDFQCKVDPHYATLQLWVGVQSGASTKIFTLTMDLLDEGELVDGWQQKWKNAWTIVTEPDMRHALATPVLGTENRTTPTKQWLDFLMYPGRFPQSSLEITLRLYQQKRNLAPVSAKALKASQRSLAERMCSSITAKIPLPAGSSNQAYHQVYYDNVHAQWNGYYSILLEIQSKRMDVLGFALDTETELAWIVHADSVAPVRATSRLEDLALNQGLDVDEEQFDRTDEAIRSDVIKTEDDWDNMRFLGAVQSFADSLPKAYRQGFVAKATAEALNTARSSKTTSIAKAFFNHVDVGQHITDEAYQSLEVALQPLNGIGGLVDSTFTALIHIAVDSGHRGVKSEFALNRYGSKLMVAAAQDFIQQEKSVLLNLLTLVAFLNNDFEAQALHDDFNAVKLFKEIMASLRHAELRDWLIRNVCLEPSRKQLILSTVFETLFIGDWDAHTPKALSFAERLTHWSRQWAFAKFSDWHGFTANIFSTLLRHNMYDLASSFIPFLQESAWTTYLRARLQLALGDYEEAALNFRTAATGLTSKIKGELDTAGFLTAEELSHLGQGPELYHLHIADLFEKLRQYAFTAEFAQDTLSHMDEEQVERGMEDIDSRRKSTKSQVETVANAIAEVKLLKVQTTWEESVSRLFNALVQTARLHEAFTALQRFKTPDLRKSNLHKLIDSCVKNDMLDMILELPLDDTAADTADAILLKLAKKAATSTGSAMEPAQRILYAFRTRRSDYRGAAQVLYERLERLRRLKRRSRQDPNDETLVQAYLILINTLACCGEDERWLLAGPIDGVHPVDQRRKLVTLDDVRREYDAELDKRSDLEHGRFPLIGGDEDDEMDVL